MMVEVIGVPPGKRDRDWRAPPCEMLVPPLLMISQPLFLLLTDVLAQHTPPFHISPSS